ncbi:MAG TPA: RidA family protein [Candidatus Dormibacteraeota bacterium]|nr:RidA family protein [Candidatus Dormibacteraeota bacterium]
MTPRRRVSSGSPFEAKIGFCRAIRVDDRVIVSGTAPIWPDGSINDDAYAQAKRCFEIIEAALTELGAKMEHVVRTRIYITGVAYVDAVSRAHAEALGDVRPAATMVIAELLNEHWKVEIEAEAVIA